MRKRQLAYVVASILAVALVLAVELEVGRVAVYGNAPGPRQIHSVPTVDHVHIVVTRVAITGALGTPSAKQSRAVVYNRQFGTVVRQIHVQLVSGELLTGGSVMSCPSAEWPYYHFELTFSRDATPTAVAISDATGCQVIELDYHEGGRDRFSWYDASNGSSFWVVLHQLVNTPLPPS